MIQRLREDPDGLAEAMEALEERVGVPFTQLEKDFWLTEALRGVVGAADEVGLDVYFKGGTSLSKVFGIIERFSEDVDLLVALPKTDELMSGNQRHRALKELCDGAQQATGLTAMPDGTKTKKGEKRAVLLGWPEPDEFTLTEEGGLRRGVLVEVGRWGGSQPHEQRAVTSVLAQHAADLRLESFEEQAPITVNVVHPVRTAVEKLALLHAAADDPDERRRANVARHYYDVWCLLRHESTRDQLRRPGVVSAIADEVLVYSDYFGHTVRERPLEGFAASDAFDIDNSALQATRKAYEGYVLGSLLWPRATHRPSFDQCCEAVVVFEGSL